MSKVDQGNPEIGMDAESIDAAAQKDSQEIPTGSVDNFFESMNSLVSLYPVFISPTISSKFSFSFIWFPSF